MASAINDIMQLLAQAKGGSGDKRRELLRQITDVFLADAKKYSETEMMLFDEIIVVVSAGLDKQVRMDLARKVLAAKATLRRTTRQLSMDEIEVAHPVIERSGVLSETDMLDVIAQTSQAPGHRRQGFRRARRDRQRCRRRRAAGKPVRASQPPDLRARRGARRDEQRAARALRS
jgi:uncharacterized protein (DUF2336 family)